MTTSTERQDESADDMLDNIEQLIRAGKDDCLTSEEIIGNVTVALRIPRTPSLTAGADSGLRRAWLDKLNAIAPAVENLAGHQEQCDFDGVMVKVSRQALDQVLNAVNDLAVSFVTAPATLIEQSKD